jgi:hypothetical protein
MWAVFSKVETDHLFLNGNSEFVGRDAVGAAIGGEIH